MENTIDTMLYIAYALFAVGVAAAIILPLWKSLSNPKTLLKPLGALAGLAILFFINWSVSDSELNARLIQAGATERVSKFVGGGLFTMYVLFVIALIGIAVTELNKALK